MGDDFEAWLRAQGMSLRLINVLIYKMAAGKAAGKAAEFAMDAVTDDLFKKFREGRGISENPASSFGYCTFRDCLSIKPRGGAACRRRPEFLHRMGRPA